MNRLDLLMKPTSIAVVGASSDMSRITGRPIPILRAYGYNGRVYPINPSQDRIGGLPCYPTVLALPETPDLVMIMVAAERVPDIVSQCVALKVPYVAVFSSGFNETVSGKGLAQTLEESIAKSGTKMLGPNTEGFIDFQTGIPIGFSPIIDPDRGSRVAQHGGSTVIISQSGGLGFAIYDQARQRDIPVRSVISTGNELSLEISDFIDYFTEDPQVTILVLFLEGIKDSRRFLEVARLFCQKPGNRILAVKVGDSPAGRIAAQSHTGKITGDREVYTALFHKAGVEVVEDFEELLDDLVCYTLCPKGSGNRVAVVSTSGGGGIWITDHLHHQGLETPPLSSELQAILRHLLPPFASVRNPIDVTAQAVYDRSIAPVINALVTSDEVDGIVLVGTFGYDHRMIGDEPLFNILKDSAKPVVIFTYTLPSKEAQRVFLRNHLPWATSPGRTGRMLARLLRPDLRPGRTQPLGQATEWPRNWMNWLQKQGIHFNATQLVNSGEEAKEAAREMGLPVVMKLAPATSIHKTEVGGVISMVRRVEDVTGAFETLKKQAFLYQIPLCGISVETFVRGHELLLGSLNTLQLTGSGPLLVLGAGGVGVEESEDRAYRIAPVSREESLEWLAELRLFKSLKVGWRGLPPGHVGRLVETLVCFSEAVCELPTVGWSAIEFNPIIVTETDAIVVDARVTGRDEIALQRRKDEIT